MLWAHWIRENWTDTPAHDGENPVSEWSPAKFGGGQWFVVAVPPKHDMAAEAVRDARAMGVRVTGLVFRDDPEINAILADLTSVDALVPASLDDSSANRWAMEAADMLKAEPAVRQILMIGNSEPMASALRREFPLASHFALGVRDCPDASEILAVLLHTPRCC